ncbi:hypothetical protein [Labrys monachus]|uniref:Uncharacterized protein n=1 Tax=Labrys monachus TaxID=217067 RepID=A0ABU0FEI6_9HYPH|nr:hypothetical protein [Labrys monachus]MDQ0393022.1 hypothetical protein [Labrys monachus]
MLNPLARKRENSNACLDARRTAPRIRATTEQDSSVGRVKPFMITAIIESSAESLTASGLLTLRNAGFDGFFTTSADVGSTPVLPLPELQAMRSRPTSPM